MNAAITLLTMVMKVEASKHLEKNTAARGVCEVANRTCCGRVEMAGQEW